MRHEMRLDEQPFNRILSGEKTIELRLYDERRRRIAPADEIVFFLRGDPSVRLRATVRELHVFPSFVELYDALPLSSCGYRSDEAANADPRDMEAYYLPQEIERWGVVGIVLQDVRLLPAPEAPRAEETAPYTVRRFEKEDLPVLEALYEKARAFMRQTGNAGQWKTYPSSELLRKDAENRTGYVVVQNGTVIGAFCLSEEREEGYRSIEGAWKSESPYATLHRVAGTPGRHGVWKTIAAYAKARFSHLRADTHPDNAIMRRLLEKEGFAFCGVIRIRDDFSESSERFAYEWIREE